MTIPDSVTYIGQQAFWRCESLTDVYYAGSEAQWKAISISSTGNNDLLTAQKHYNYGSHTHSYKDVVTAPTCTEKGYTTHTCSCGDSYVDTYVDALGHAWDNGKVTKKPTETETGVKTFTCTRCGETRTETMPVIPHVHSYKDVVTAPTCTAKGYTTHTCACGDSYVDTYTDALGHAWDEGKVTKEPTETETGVKTLTCTRCGETKTEVIPATGVVASGTCGAEGDGSNLTWTLDSEGVLTISGSGDMHGYDLPGAPWHGSRVKSAVIAEGVTSIGEHAFYDCTSLTSVTIPGSVTSIGLYAFFGCKSLTSVTIPDSVTSIGVGAFASCTSLAGIWVAEGNSHYANDASGVLFNKDKTTLVQCPGAFAAYTIPDSVTSIGGSAFRGCSSLTSVTIPDSVTSIGDDAFCNCRSLTSVTIPDSVTLIDNGAFQGCTSLTSVTIPDSVTSIGDRTFSECTSLTSVTIPDSVTSIGYSAFYYCTSLTDVYYAGSEAQWKAISISSNGNEDLLTANIHYNYVSHTHSYKDVVTAPTCTEKGYTTHTCACGDSYVDTYTDPLGHDLKDDAAVAATCTTAGTTAGKHCTRCDYKEGMETIAALGHDLKDDAAVAATCTTAGTTAGKHCTRCDYKEGMETIAALGHAWDEGEMTKEATETTQGSMTYTCTRCPATKRDILPASGLVATAVYNDVKNDTSWFYPGVQYCLSYGLMSGMGNGSFAPGEYTTRAQVAQILYNLHGNPEVSGGTPFTDVPEGAWYQKAVTWAHSVGIVNGVTATTFSPNANITRQDFVLMLMRYLNNVRMVDRTWKPDDLSRFADAGSVGFWALDAMKDAVAINAISGAPVDGRLYIQPARNATRAEAAKILMVSHKTMTK